MIYVEFVERDRFVPIELFRYVGNQDSIWVEKETDHLLLQLGRTFRFGPMPSYLAFWYIPSMGRIDVWQDYFTSDAAFRNERSNAMHRAIHVQRAGLYDEIVMQLPDDRPRGAETDWYIEYFDVDATTSNASLEALFSARAAAHPDVSLDLVLRRVGMLGPDPANLAVWSAPRFENFEQLARSAPGVADTPVRSAGFYRNLGHETV